MSFSINLDVQKIDFTQFESMPQASVGELIAHSGGFLSIRGFGLDRWPTVDELDIDILFEEFVAAAESIRSGKDFEISLFEQHLGVSITFEGGGEIMLASASSFVGFALPMDTMKISRKSLILQVVNFFSTYLGVLLISGRSHRDLGTLNGAVSLLVPPPNVES